MRIRATLAGRANRAKLASNSLAGPVLLGVEVADQLTHREHRLGGGAVGHHLLGEAAQGVPLHLGVLEPAEHVLQVLEVGDACLRSASSTTGANTSSA